MPAPYLYVPLEGSELEDDEYSAACWVAHLAQECLAMGDKICLAFDQYDEHWKPDQMQDVEAIHRDLTLVLSAMQKAGLCE